MRQKTTQPGGKDNTVRTLSRLQSPSVAHPSKSYGIAAPLLDLQRTHGNRFVQGLLNGTVIQRTCACGGTCTACQSEGMPQHHHGDLVQPKLTISQPGDMHEQEADRVADIVMRLPEPETRRGRAVSPQVQAVHMQRLCSACEEPLHRQPSEEEDDELLQAQEIPGRAFGSCAVRGDACQHLERRWPASTTI